MGVIDSLSAGYRLVTRRWWLILIPIMLDLFLWFGPRISVAQLIQDMKGLLVLPAGVELGKDYQNALTQSQQMLDQMATNVNLLTLLTIGIPGIPSLMASVAAQGGQPAAMVQLHSTWQAIVWSLGLLLSGALLGSLYVTWIGRAVLSEDESVRAVPLHAQTLQTWGRVLLFVLVILGFLMIIGVPVFLLVGFMLLMSQSVGFVLLNILSVLLIWFVIWMAIYLYFVVDAIVINRVKLLKAIWNSVNVVIRNFWSTIGLIVLINVISAGMMLIWQRFTFATWSTLFGIVANAFIGTGLTAASLIFYNERYRRWQEIRNATDFGLFLQKWGGSKKS